MPIKDDVFIGNGTKIWHPELVNLFGCSIGNFCNIGCFVEIGPGVKIGDRCRIQSMVYICSGVTIEADVFIGPGTVFLNDKYPPSPKPFVPEEIVVKQSAIIGGGVLILPGIVIGECARIGAGAVVTKDVAPGEIVVGVPARCMTSA